MAISAAVQTLSAAFVFGILFQAATGALLIYLKGHGSTIFKDGRRLVLVLFLLFAALWAQIDFLNMLILKPSICQATILLSTAFDQLARVGLEQFLLWSMAQRTKLSSGQIILQVIVGLRLIAGGVLVGFTRPDFTPVCIARTSLEPVAIAVIAVDFLIIGVLLVRSASLGMFRDMRDSRSRTQDQSRGLVLTIGGFTVWTATSVPMMLGIPTIIFLARTVVPTNGLLILVGILTFCGGSLLEMREEITTPEAHSPFVAPSVPFRESFRENIGNGSPISGLTYTKSGSLFVVNPSSTPGVSPIDPQKYFQAAAPGTSKLGEEMKARGLGTEEHIPKTIPGYRGSSGVFPTITSASLRYDQGAFAPNIKINVVDSSRNVPTLSVPRPTAGQKKSLFSRSKQPAKPDFRSLKISKPVMQEVTGAFAQPFAKIHTIDLAQAATNERERREAAADRSRLVANRPAPPSQQQFAIPAEVGFRHSISVKRKEMPNSRPLEPMPTITRSASSELSVDATNGSTTSASLSPGREEVRRRSPRNANSFDKLIDEKARSMPFLQPKQTVGLPSNPRAIRIGPPQSMAKEQTVMLMNDIVYDNPGIVKSIIKGAPEMYASAQRAKTSEKSSVASYTTDLKSAGSIIHRPRPYRKYSDVNRALFPSESSPRHRRSKSGSSILSPKSFLMPYPGSPTNLPPLPAPPTSAANLKRLLPNDTKSMTLDEKIHLLFPAPPGVAIRNRRSSVPSLPRAPSVFMSDTPLMQSPIQEQQQSRRTSKRSTIASFIMPGSHHETSTEDSTKAQERQTYRLSPSTNRDLADRIVERRISGNQPIVGSLAPDVVDVDSHMTETNSIDISIDNDSATYWGSIHSEIPPIDLGKVMRNANSTFIQRPRAVTVEEVNALPPPRVVELHEGEEIMSVMLDCEDGCQSIVKSEDYRQSFFLDADQSLPGDKTPTTVNTWHHRVGDELLTFSERKASTRSRKMPPPAPLLLNNRGRRATVVLRAAEPSPPVIDSPERAIAEIQAQLKRFEESNRGSVGSLLRHIPDAASSGNDATNEDRFKLLEDLEDEMGQQENQWQQMQTDLHRDSISTIMTPQSSAQTEANISRESSQRSSRPPSIAASRRARIRSSMTVRFNGEESISTTSSQSSDNSRASIWQQRLAEAQIKYIKNAPELLRKRSLNFLSVSKAQQIGSPTPPESVDSGTDIETDSEVESENEQANVHATKDTTSLWNPQLHRPSPRAAVSRMWSCPTETTDRAASPEPPATSLRPAQRHINFSLRIHSSDLWSKPTSAVNSRPVVGLWGSSLARPVGIKTRPVTQRPPRKSKRVTFLPDIVENPIPLPNKRNTLGIFQFPWGETSDSAVYQPNFNPALLAGPILNSNLHARSHQLEPETEYSSSFFDDYDEEMDEDEEFESDDDFDETMLWEIASLLKSDNVPSKNSLLPPARDIVEDYNEDEETDFEEDEEAVDFYQATKTAQFPVTQLPIMPLAMASKEAMREESILLASGLIIASETVKTGLPQPEPTFLQADIPSPKDAIHAKPLASQDIPVVAPHNSIPVSESNSTSLSVSPSSSGSTTPALLSDVVKQEPNFMWTSSTVKTEEQISGLFSMDIRRLEFRTTHTLPAARSMSRAPRTSNASLLTLSSKSLWTPEQNLKKVSPAWTSINLVEAPAQTTWTSKPKVESVAILGLFSSSHVRSDYRTTNLVPVAQSMIIKSRSSHTPLAQLTSTSLWSRCSNLPFERHWISESSIRPTSPSIFSESSSGQSSPVSETSSISGASLKSTSTNASSHCRSTNSSTPIMWGSKGFGKSPNPPLIDNSKLASKPSLANGKGFEPVRESRVLASRDIWELRALAELSETPKRSFGVRKSITPAPQMQETVQHENLRQKLRRTAASKADWNAALAEAIAKSTIPDAVLSPQYDTVVRHQLSSTDSLLSTASEVYPTATREMVINTTPYDPAVLHPVFFTSSFVTSATDIHPAALGRVTRPQPKSLWRASLSRFETIESPIGPMWLNGKAAAPQFEHEKTVTTRKPVVSQPILLQRLESTKVWQPSQQAPVAERNWILSAKRAHS